MVDKLNLYIAEMWHEAGISPRGNGAYRPVSHQSRALLPKLMAERGMRSLGMYRLDPSHRAIFIFEARSVEDVRDVLYNAKFLHWCDGQIFPVTRLNELHHLTGQLAAAVTTSATPIERTA